MKKTVLILILAFVSFSLFATETIWMWDHNDSDVAYYRYSTSFDERWRVVPADHFSVKIDSGETEDYVFYLQQSYDGINWSESNSGNHGKIGEEKKTVTRKPDDNGLILGLQIVPFQSYIATKPHDSRVEKKSAYSVGIDAYASYFFKKIALGVLLSGNVGWEEFSFVPFRATNSKIFGGAYITLSYEVMDGERYMVVVHGGLGTNFEIVKNITYLSPSAMVAMEGGIHINENVIVSMKPSFTFSTGTWNNSGSYTSFVIKTVSLGTTYKF